MNRDIMNIMDNVIECIPEDFENREELIFKINKIRNSMGYTPPEQIGLRWAKLCSLLNKYLGLPDKPWKEKIDRIMQNKE